MNQFLISILSLLLLHGATGAAVRKDGTKAWSWRELVGLGADPECSMDALEIIRHWGYEGEEHAVTTSDGYILSIQRIPYGKAGPGNGEPRPVIFLQHGLECSSTNWITNLPSESAGFLFADAGFDVWLGNFRGNTYGLRHVSLTPKEHAFWEFSWDEMAAYDLPAMIDYVLEHTGQEQLYYMGHSEGTMTALGQFTQDPSFSAKVKRFFALGPVATVKHIGGLLSWIAPFTNEIEWLADLVGYDQFLPNSWLLDQVAKFVCGWVETNPLCDSVLFLVAGPNSHQLNETRVPVYISHTPAGTSTQNVVHFGQMVHSGLFQKYNYGTQGNNLHYGTNNPPVYDLTKVEVPTYLFWGQLDILADPTDIKDNMIPYLPNLKGNFNYSDFNHLDFIWGLRAAPEVYSKVLSIIKSEDGIPSQ